MQSVLEFKVAALSNWRGGENEYAVLVSPHFQYPKAESQIYKTALVQRFLNNESVKTFL